MRRDRPGLFVAGLLASAALAGVINARDAQAEEAAPVAAAEASAASSVEEIYVLRSLRETRDGATAFCSPLDAPTSEDHYAFYVPAVSSGDGRITDTKAKRAGHIHGCFGKTNDAEVFSFYGTFEINSLQGTARGDCRTGSRDFPEPGLSTFACRFSLTGLPEPYAGGQLTTNSLGSKNATGEASDPPGYTQVSIATVRLWKKR